MTIIQEEKKDLPKITNEMREQLRAEFPAEAYKQHDSKKFLTTLKSAYVFERLNDVFGIGRWNVEHEVVSHENGYVLMKGILKILDYDCHIPEQYGGHITKGTNVALDDGYKSAITAIISKSASYLEIGIDMFKGLITPPSDNKKPDQNIQTAGPEILTKNFVDNEWNGKLYGNCIYINNVKYQVPNEKIEQLKQHPKYQQQ